MKFMRQYLLSLLLTFAMVSGAYAAADVGNTAVISPVDASNASGTCPSWSGSAAPSTIDDSGRCLQGAIAREWQNRSFAVTSTGSADAYVVAYTQAPAAYRTGQVYSFITNFTVAGTATVNINSLGAKTIKKDVAGVLTALSSGDMSSGQFVMLAYNATDMIWVNWQGSGTVAASTTASGIVELATTAEAAAQSDTDRAVTPQGLAFKPESLCVAASDETTLLTTGTAKVTFRMPYAFTVTAIRGSLSTVATGASLLTIDVNEGGTTIISTKMTFDASESTSTSAATPLVISDTALADDAQMTIDIDQVGNTTAGKGIKVCLIGHQ